MDNHQPVPTQTPALNKILIVITGPTAIGKTRLAIAVAQKLNTEIISADSRQFYKELKIGSAAPSQKELKQVPHHFVGHLSVTDYYNVYRFEQEVLEFLEGFFKNHNYAVMTGGSGLYMAAVCHGIDKLPDPDHAVREGIRETYLEHGIEPLLRQLKISDPVYFQEVDHGNPARIMRALEVCKATGKPYSMFRKNVKRPRPFRIIKIGLNRPRNELVEIISKRVDQMITNGLVDEARSLLPYRNENALKTVGYSEIFDHFDGKLTMDQAIEKIKTNTRRYAKRQLTWFRKDDSIRWFHPDQQDKVLEFLKIQ